MVDGVAAATVAVQGLVTMGLRTSAIGEFSRPAPKAYDGLLSGFTVRSDGARRDVGTPREGLADRPRHGS